MPRYIPIIGISALLIMQGCVSQDQHPDIAAVDLQHAREILINYFRLLHEQKYAEASLYHGAGYFQLQEWNPFDDPQNFATLLKNGCERNGLQCLEIKEIKNQRQTSPTEFTFIVQFVNEDGSLFKQGPCCGATEESMPTRTEFEYVVRKSNDRFMVMTLPVYIP